MAANGSVGGDPPDKLLLSALKYWEVERDLIEERLDHHEVCDGGFLGRNPTGQTEAPVRALLEHPSPNARISGGKAAGD